MGGLRKRDRVEACAQSMATTKILLNLERRRLRPRAGLELVAGICVCGAGGRVAHVGPAGRCSTIARCWLNCEPTANKWTERLRFPMVQGEMQPRSTVQAGLNCPCIVCLWIPTKTTMILNVPQIQFARACCRQRSRNCSIFGYLLVCIQSMGVNYGLIFPKFRSQLLHTHCPST